MTWGRIYWPLFLVFITVAFMTPEGYALATGKANTLSYWVWRELRPASAQWYLSLGFYLTVVSWLVYHFWFKEFR